MNIGSILRLEVQSSAKNFDNKSMAFYGYSDVNDMSWLMSHKEILLVHTNYETKEQRSFVMSGMKLFNQINYATIKKKKTVVFRYK